MYYIDFHTHTSKTEQYYFSVCSIRAHDIEEIEGSGPYTLGIHPWDSVYNNIDYQLNKIKRLISDQRVIAVGEIGLDKLRGASMEVQIELFKKQVQIAEEIQKPVVIHCVRSFSEIQQLRKELKPTTPWVIHNFMGNEHIAQSLIKQGFYLSFCIALAKSSKLCKSLRSVPINRILFETDDFIDRVEDVYAAAAICLDINPEALLSQVVTNFNDFFNSRVSSV